eukprot:CAMPEP_0185436220 /NCGR_PEP_ID=MMETSP1365-20130426/27191_1 /TAXON_ID=38817 /ORGANISM="Gephyrocapsa oceanica, Strain RCC1303" /LENGTH=51 /DNA_ID=CAMNT_0028040977 /DNA_START=4 /DNA_END=156 /DNA_ORIENTATION=-
MRFSSFRSRCSTPGKEEAGVSREGAGWQTLRRGAAASTHAVHVVDRAEQLL